MYTSKELSKKLKNSGCKLDSKKYIIVVIENGKYVKTELVNGKWKSKKGTYNDGVKWEEKVYPTYDILNDICVKYAKEFFGDNRDSANQVYRYVYISIQILQFIQQNKIKEAEDYIWEHCLFNPKNKK